MAAKLKQITGEQYLELLACGVPCWAHFTPSNTAPENRIENNEDMRQWVLDKILKGGDLGSSLESIERWSTSRDYTLFTVVEEDSE
jgi:hypothetical protein